MSGSEVPRHKPYPDIYLHMAELLDVWPEECVVIEDSMVRGRGPGGGHAGDTLYGGRQGGYGVDYLVSDMAGDAAAAGKLTPVTLIPKCHRSPSLSASLRSRLPLAFFVEEGALMSAASMIVPPHHVPAFCKTSVDSVKERFTQTTSSIKRRKCSSVVASGACSVMKSIPMNFHCIAVVYGILDTFI